LRRVEQVMGTPISLDLADDLPRAALDELADDCYRWLREVDRRFSTYQPDSEVSRFGRGELPFDDLSPDLRAVLARCADLWTATDGYFDAYAAGGLDPSGYVKGWSAQVASDRLLAAGAGNHCLNAGGDVRVRGHNAAGRPWRIGIRHPWDPALTCWVLSGTDLAVATSGVYERGHHVIDPRTGAPAHGLRSVTVVGTDLGEADAYATAAVAMGVRGVRWLGGLPGYECAAVTDDRRYLRSNGLPVASSGPAADAPADVAGPAGVPAGAVGHAVSAPGDGSPPAGMSRSGGHRPAGSRPGVSRPTGAT
jgi:thiamine biosynthesis lipoprotein